MQATEDQSPYFTVALSGLAFLILIGILPTAGGTVSPDDRDVTMVSEGTWPAPKVYRIALNSDDGTECGGTWYPNGITMGVGCLGKNCADDFVTGFRFAVPDLDQGQSIPYARLLLSAQGGAVTSGVSLCIWGSAEDSPATFSAGRRPSELPRTDDSVMWCLGKAWEATGAGLPLYRVSPNLAPVINEILGRGDWGLGENGKQIALVIEQAGCASGEANYLDFEDYSTEFEVRDQALLEVYRSLAEAMPAKPMLGRVTDSSAVLNMMCLLSIDAYAEYGTGPAIYDRSTSPLLNRPAGQPVEIALSGLVPDTTYYYRVRYREAGDGDYLEGQEGTFNTQRSRQSGFVFAIQSDAHPYLVSEFASGPTDWRLYEQTLANISADEPDFLIDMGDFVDLEGGAYARSILSAEDARNRYLEQRKYLDKITHSIPFYLVLGNHEGEQGWRAANEDDSMEVWAALARKSLIPNPAPDAFYTGDQEYTECCGLREAYYAWEWGDALFVVIDPIWHTINVPHWYSEYPRQGDGWEWTLGQEQYEWFYETLHGSDATWKFVFSHHEAGGVLTDQSYYGRGGIESAKYNVDGRPSFEWGGEDIDGNDVFGLQRPGWEHGPIHDIMVAEGVTIFFHGPDHVYVYQTLDGVVYQACPRPKDSKYSDGFWSAGKYASGKKVNNSGHLRVAVDAGAVEVAYVRSVLAEQEPLSEDTTLVFNGDVSHSYTIALSGMTPAGKAIESARLLPARPNPFLTSMALDFFVPRAGPARIAIHDVRGRLLSVLFDGPVSPGLHHVYWDGRTDRGRMPPGIYFCRLETGKSAETAKVILLE